MANSTAICTSFKTELLNGHHAFGTSVVRAGTGADVWKAALYVVTANNGASTAAYSTTDEVTNGAGYTTGGVTLTWIAPSSSGTTAFSTPSAAFAWTSMTKSGFDAVLIYNSTQANKAAAVFNFGSQTVTAANFTLNMPTNDSSTGLIRLA